MSKQVKVDKEANGFSLTTTNISNSRTKILNENNTGT